MLEQRSESNIPSELIDGVSKALDSKGKIVTDEQMRDPDWLTDKMGKLPQFVQYQDQELRAAINVILSKAEA